MQSHPGAGPRRSTAALSRLLKRLWQKGVVLLALIFVPAICIAHQLSTTECTEGSDFIKNAVLARDGGMSEVRFIDKINEDIQVIQSLPPQLRWFVQDDDDAEFLLAAATDVFRH